jgi:hypothetical protein
MSISLRFLKKVRCRFLDGKSDQPAAGVVVSLHAGLGESGKSARFPVGTLCSDSAGYVSFDLHALIDAGLDSVQDLVLRSSRIPDGEVHLLNLIVNRDGIAANRQVASLNLVGAEAGAHLPAAHDAPGMCFVFPVRVIAAPGDDGCGCTPSTLPAIQNPDVCDYEASPYSFVSRVAVSLGDGCCETLVPASLPIQQHRFYKVVVRREDSALNPEIFKYPEIDEVDVTGALLTRRPTIKFAEVLEFQQDWYSLGHSLGEIKYSLALAPGEATQIAIIDWARQDAQSRTDDVSASEYMDHLQKADRTIQETVDSALHETQGGNSFMVGSSGQATLPLTYVTMTFNHAIGASVSNSWGNRDLEGESLQSIHNTVRQQTGYTRALNSTVVVQANQAEQNFLQTRRVANHNHCHALTIQYYEVLRHFRIDTQFSGRTKAVLIPFSPFIFQAEDAVRFRSILEPALIDPAVAPGFDAALRLRIPNAPPPPAGNTPAPLVPKTTSVDVKVRGIEGEGVGSGLNVKPNDQIRIQASGKVMLNRGIVGDGGLGSYTTGPNGEANASAQGCIAPHLKKNSLIFKIGSDGSWQQAGTITNVLAIRTGEVIFGINDLANSFADNYGTNADAFDVHLDVTTMAPPDTPADPVVTNEETTEEKAAKERAADQLRLAQLLVHLNGNQGFYNSAVWVLQSAVDRRIRLEQALSSYPDLMSAIDDTPIAVSGNYVAFPYDGPFPNWVPVRETDPRVPLQDIVTLPTRGVFAEAQLGHCNACEERDPTRMSDWTEMTTESPPEISGIKPGATGQAPTVTPATLPGNVISIAATPQVPDPTGLAAALKVIGTPDIFRDMSGLKELEDLLEKLSEESSEGNIKALAQRAMQKLDDAKASSGTGSSGGATGSTRSGASETDAGKQIDRLKAIEYAKDKGLIDDTQGNDAAQGVLGGEQPGAGATQEDALGVTINLSRYCTPAVRAFSPPNASGQTTLRAVVTGAPAGSTWHWRVANPTAARIVSPSAYITEVIAGDPGLTDVTFEARDSGGASLGTRTVKLSVPQFLVIDEDAAAFDPVLVGYHLDDVKPLVLQRAREVVEKLLVNVNIRAVWRLAPFNEPLPAHLAAGGFAAGKFNPVTIRGANPVDTAIAGTTQPGGPAVFNEAIDIYPAAFRLNGLDVGADVASIVTRIAAMNLTDPNIKYTWIEIMGRLLGENIAHEILHALLGAWPGFVGGHNSPAIPFDLLNRGGERNWLQRTAIEILDPVNFPSPGSFRDGGVAAISGLQQANQGKIDGVFPVPPALA